MVASEGLRVVFFGTPMFAVPTLEALLASRHTVVGVVTQPDKPSGRGQKTTDSAVKTVALRAGLPVLQPSSLKDATFLSALEQVKADLGVVAAYGKILTERVLQIPQQGMLNVHASLLPRYRGAAPVHRAVIAGERETGVTIMRVVRALDAGPMLAMERRPIDPDETSDVVERDLARIGAALLVSTLDALALNPSSVVERPQDESASTYANRLTKEDGRVDWSASADGIHNLIRGLYPWPHAYTFWKGQRLILLKAAAVHESTHPLAGTVVMARGDELIVACGTGLLRVTELQMEGKRPVDARAFLAGHGLAPGDRFTDR